MRLVNRWIAVGLVCGAFACSSEADGGEEDDFDSDVDPGDPIAWMPGANTLTVTIRDLGNEHRPRRAEIKWTTSNAGLTAAASNPVSWTDQDATTVRAPTPETAELTFDNTKPWTEFPIEFAINCDLGMESAILDVEVLYYATDGINEVDRQDHRRTVTCPPPDGPTSFAVCGDFTEKVHTLEWDGQALTSTFYDSVGYVLRSPSIIADASTVYAAGGYISAAANGIGVAVLEDSNGPNNPGDLIWTIFPKGDVNQLTEFVGCGAGLVASGSPETLSCDLVGNCTASTPELGTLEACGPTACVGGNVNLGVVSSSDCGLNISQSVDQMRLDGAGHITGTTFLAYDSFNTEVVRSTNDGVTWTASANGVPGGQAIRGFVGGAVAAGMTVVATDGGTLYASTDMGDTWVESTAPEQARQHDFSEVLGQFVAISGSGRVMLSEDGVTFAFAPEGDEPVVLPGDLTSCGFR